MGKLTAQTVIVEDEHRPYVSSGGLKAACFSPESLEVLGVREMLKTFKVTEVPEHYIKPPHMRQQVPSPGDTLHQDPKRNQILTVDLSAPREELLRTTAEACKYGFFQIINHGIPKKLLQKVSSEANEFFALPVEEKIKCTTPAKVAGPVHFGGGTKGDWRDVLKLLSAPPSAAAMECWPRQPTGFRDTLISFSARQQILAMRLFGIISESLGLDKGYIEDECGDPRVLMALNHYPPSPDPSLTMGIREHSDPNSVTLLLQDQVGGLQVLKEGTWIDVPPMENALVVNIGDHLQILSNGRYSSCLHRVVNNKCRSRTSIAIFFSPSLQSRVGPAPELVDDEHPAMYREFCYADFLRDFYRDGGPNRKVILSRFQSSRNPEVIKDRSSP